MPKAAAECLRNQYDAQDAQNVSISYLAVW